MATAVFMIVGRNEPLYEAEIALRPNPANRNADRDRDGSATGQSAYLAQFIIHSALDMVERRQTVAPYPYLKVVDKFNDQVVSAYLTSGGVKFMLLHDNRHEDAVGNFFREVHELYVKVRRCSIALVLYISRHSWSCLIFLTVEAIVLTLTALFVVIIPFAVHAEPVLSVRRRHHDTCVR